MTVAALDFSFWRNGTADGPVAGFLCRARFPLSSMLWPVSVRQSLLLWVTEVPRSVDHSWAGGYEAGFCLFICWTIVHMFLYGVMFCFLLGVYLGQELAGCYGDSLFNILRSCHTDSQRSCTILCVQQRGGRGPLPPCLLYHCVSVSLCVVDGGTSLLSGMWSANMFFYSVDYLITFLSIFLENKLLLIKSNVSIYFIIFAFGIVSLKWRSHPRT